MKWQEWLLFLRLMILRYNGFYDNGFRRMGNLNPVRAVYSHSHIVRRDRSFWFTIYDILYAIYESWQPEQDFSPLEVTKQCSQ